MYVTIPTSRHPAAKPSLESSLGAFLLIDKAHVWRKRETRLLNFMPLSAFIGRTQILNKIRPVCPAPEKVHQNFQRCLFYQE